MISGYGSPRMAVAQLVPGCWMRSPLNHLLPAPATISLGSTANAVAGARRERGEYRQKQATHPPSGYPIVLVFPTPPDEPPRGAVPH